MTGDRIIELLEANDRLESELTSLRQSLDFVAVERDALRESLAQAQRDLATVRAELATMMESNAGLTNDVLAMRKERDDALKLAAVWQQACEINAADYMRARQFIESLRVPEPRPDEVGS